MIRKFLLKRPIACFSTNHDPKDHARLHSVGSQVETEWKKPIKGVDFDSDTLGYEVPGVFREFRH